MGKSHGLRFPALLSAPIFSARVSRYFEAAPLASIDLMIRARSISNNRGTTTMIVGCTSSMLAASFSRLSE